MLGSTSRHPAPRVPWSRPAQPCTVSDLEAEGGHLELSGGPGPGQSRDGSGGERGGELSPGQGEGTAPRSRWFWKRSGASGQGVCIGVCMCVHVCGCVCTGFTHPGLSPPSSQLDLINQTRPLLDPLSDSRGSWLDVPVRPPGWSRCSWAPPVLAQPARPPLLIWACLVPSERGFTCLLASLPAPGTTPGTW